MLRPWKCTHRLAVLITLFAVGCATDPGTQPPIEDPEPTTISVSTSSVSLAAIGQSAQLDATVRDQNGGAMAGEPVTWNSADTGVVSVSGSGLVTAVGNGSTQVSATSGTLNTSVTVTVEQSAAAIETSADTLTLSGPSDQASLTATLVDGLGSEVEGSTISWSIDDPTIATIDSDGLVAGVASGTTFATASGTAGGQSASADVVVVVNSLSMGVDDFCGDFAPEAEPAFASSGLENKVRDKLGLGPSDTMTCAMLATIDSMIVLPVPGSIVTSLAGAQNLVGLDSLWLGGQAVNNLSPIAQLPELSLLALGNTDVDDAGLAPLSTLTSLKWLAVGNTEVSDLSPLSSLAGLEVLDVQSTNVTDLSPVSDLDALTVLLLDNTGVSDLAPISGLTELAVLALGRTDVTTLAPVAGRSSLREVYFSQTDVESLSPLLGLSGLTHVWMENTGIQDLSPLMGLTGLLHLDAAQNGITDLEGVQGLVNIESLDLGANPIADIDHISALVSLTRLDLSSMSTSFSNVLPLQNLSALTYLNLAGNSALSDIQPLITNTGLGVGDEVFLQLTSVSCDDVNALRNEGAEVTASLCPAS